MGIVGAKDGAQSLTLEEDAVPAIPSERAPTFRSNGSSYLSIKCVTFSRMPGGRLDVGDQGGWAAGGWPEATPPRTSVLGSVRSRTALYS
jgi:hypothetical protein